MYARPAPRSGHGIERTLVQIFADPRTQGFTPGRRKAALRDMQDTPLVFEARQLPQGERLIVATNRPGLQALDEYRKRWAVECLFGDLKTRGFNLEDTRLRDPAKLTLLLSLLAIAAAWASRAAQTIIAKTVVKRKSHGYPAKSTFRTGCDDLPNRTRSGNAKAIPCWPIIPKKLRVV
jgi:Transposase DDE domain